MMSGVPMLELEPIGDVAVLWVLTLSLALSSTNYKEYICKVTISDGNMASKCNYFKLRMTF